MNLTYSILIVAAVMIAIEAVRPGRSWPRVAGWWRRAALLNGVQAAVAYASALLWDRWMADHRWWTAEALGPVGGPMVGYLTITFIYYWWHRWRHTIPFLWRWFHQVHHSPQRIEIITSFYKHPVEIIVNGLLSSAILYFGVGLDPAAAAVAVLLTGLAELFYHWNVATPRWLGFIVQRPESHCVHHQEGVHSFNYADLPLWDMLFGTFRNPHRFEGRCGFGPRTEPRLAEMLRGVELS